MAGFTLIELIVGLTIAGILAALAIPAVGTFVQSSRLSAATNDLMGDLNYARSEVLKLKTNGTGVSINAGVCKSTDGATCTATGTWTSGWIVFVDNDASAAWSSGDIVLRAHEGLPASVTVTASADTILYNNQGFLETGAGSYTLCNSTLAQARTIQVSTTGRPNLSRGAC